MKKSFLILAILFCLGSTSFAQMSLVDVKLVNVYPNPASSYINFEFNDAENLSTYSLKIFSFTGQKVFERNQLTALLVINLNDFFRGQYNYQLTDRSGSIKAGGRFLISR